MGNPDSDSLSKNENIENLNTNLVQVPPREALINTAVTFLCDKKIQNQDSSLVKQFLLKKGLTEEETKIAFQRVEESKKNHIQVQHLLPSGLLPQCPPPPVSSMSAWHTAHSIITTVTSVGGILYALYWLWKTYISPWLFGRRGGSRPRRKPVETSLAELEAAVGSCVADVKGVRSSLEILADQRATELANGVIVSRIQEVKSEINSLKSLLLNRNQFPAAPAPLGIPAWQLSAASATLPSEQEPLRERDEEEGSGSSGSQGGHTTNGSDSSLEIVKDPNH